MRSWPVTPRTSAAEMIRAEAFESALRPRVLGLAAAPDAPTWRLVHLERGAAAIQIGDETFELGAPCLTWQPWTPEHRLRIAAGAVGTHVLIGSAVLAGAIGRAPEAPELHFLTDRRAHLPLEARPDLEPAIRQVMAGIRHERDAEQPGERTVIEALLRVALIWLWRAGASQTARSGGRPSVGYLSQFHTLVEVQYRDRWTVAKYAGALGISTDRLTDICRRGRGQTPKQLVDARLASEARYLLENSLQSIDQIAGRLGFPSAAQFSRFFKSCCGLPPGQFRRQNAARRSPAEPVAAAILSAWP
jgi:AraC family transcriptional activator of pobA